MTPYRKDRSYVRVSAVTPALSLGDITKNVEEITRLSRERAADSVEVIAFPELALTGYTMGDLFENSHTLTQVEAGLTELASATADIESVIIVGAPLSVANALYNCAVVMRSGVILGVVPKSFLPNYKEFYEMRWFRSGRDITNSDIKIQKQVVPFGTDILFELEQALFGVEICEDVWSPNPPSVAQALAGAHFGVNISASNELIGKAPYRRSLIAAHSARTMGGYVYVSSGVHESTADVVFSGHNLIAANGRVEAESERFKTDSTYITHDLDIDHISHDRRVNTSFESEINSDFRIVRLHATATEKKTLEAVIAKHPFVPSNQSVVDERAEEILNIQAHGLATQLRNANIQRVTLGLSGGLDSTLALIVAIRAADILGVSTKNIHTYTMPGYASSDRTQDNASDLAAALGTTHTVVPIAELTTLMLEKLGHDGKTEDVTYENAQARVRTEILMNSANKEDALVLGTGDLSEIALGWCTFNGDHMSMYNVNASIPKTLVRHLVRWASGTPEFSDAKSLLRDILDTPVSPELTSGKNGAGQKTEDLIGPYELHDFFLYYLVRYGDGKDKIRMLAREAFSDQYSAKIIDHWLDVFTTRFTRNQFKRESAPNGPKVGTVSLSQRGDWRMPPGASANWL